MGDGGCDGVTVENHWQSAHASAHEGCVWFYGVFVVSASLTMLDLCGCYPRRNRGRSCVLKNIRVMCELQGQIQSEYAGYACIIANFGNMSELNFHLRVADTSSVIKMATTSSRCYTNESSLFSPLQIYMYLWHFAMEFEIGNDPSKGKRAGY